MVPSSSSVMEAQGTSGNAKTADQQIQLNEQNLELNNFVPKARKPYTITKERERWTDEEHGKFVEALKLHGRAWRRIEEHVGTKTAIQIRSHAQKFFAKIARETNERSMKPIVIPPPRPKRKPAHPYPRKMQNPSKTSSSDQTWRPVSPNLSMSEQEDNQSPVSVMSSIGGSDVFGSDDSNSPSSRVSPAISALPCELKSSLELIPMERRDGSIKQPAPKQILKLFGKTVVITDDSMTTSSSSGSVDDTRRETDKSSEVETACPEKKPELLFKQSKRSAFSQIKITNSNAAFVPYKKQKAFF